MERVLDFSGPVDVNLLDMVVNAVYVGTPEEVRIFTEIFIF